MQRTLLSASIAAVSFFTVLSAQAAGYYVDEQSALRLGDAFSGGSASASDASAAFYGPASMLLVRDELVLNASAISASSKFKGTAVTGNGTTAIQGGTAKTETTDVLPTFYMVKRLDEKMALGAFVNAPYSTGNEFGKGSVARYQAADSEILGIDAGVSLAYRIHDNITLGGSFILQYLKATTGVAVNSQMLCLGAEGTDLPAGTCATLGLAPLGTATDDGYFEMEGHNVVAGYQLGALFEFSANSRLGVNYRSKMSHSLAGDATAEFPTTGFTSLAGLAGTIQGDGRATFNTPEVASISYFHQFGALALQADASWTNWTRFETLTIESRDATIAQFTAAPQVYDWKETYRVALGASYAVNESLTLRGGFAFDQSPIADENVKVDFAFDDYKAISLGATYHLNSRLALDAGVQHTLQQERDLTQGAAELASTGSALNGKVTTEVTSFALGLRVGI